MGTSVRCRILETTGFAAGLAPHGRMQRAVDRLAAARAPVLLVGSPGRGKRWLARALHAASGGGSLQLVEPGDAAASAGEVLEFESLLRTPAAGSVMLPPLNRLPRRWQAVLADVLERRRVRVIATLESDTLPTSFESPVQRALLDCFLPLRVPPLRDRAEDIEHLTRLAMAVAAARAGVAAPPLGDLACVRLRGYAWPGDCAELERFAERAVSLRSVELALLDFETGERPSAQEWAHACERLARGETIDLDVVCRRVVRHAERGWIERVAAAAAGDARRLAALLGLSPAALSAKLRDLGLSEMGA